MSHYVTNAKKRWPRGVVPFELSRAARQADEASRKGGQTALGIAILEYQSKTNCRLIPRSPAKHPDYVKIVIDPHRPPGLCNSSSIGRKGGRQFISCAPGILSGPGLIHEFGHVLGLKHEHQRWDRDDNVIVNLIAADVARRLGDMKKVKPIYFTLSGRYDFRSAMHYARSKMMVKRTPRTAALGGDTLSAGDVAGLLAMYPVSRRKRISA